MDVLLEWKSHPKAFNILPHCYCLGHFSSHIYSIVADWFLGKLVCRHYSGKEKNKEMWSISPAVRHCYCHCYFTALPFIPACFVSFSPCSRVLQTVTGGGLAEISHISLLHLLSSHWTVDTTTDLDSLSYDTWPRIWFYCKEIFFFSFFRVKRIIIIHECSRVIWTFMICGYAAEYLPLWIQECFYYLLVCHCPCCSFSCFN